MIKSEAGVVGFAVGNVEQWDKTRHFCLKEMRYMEIQRKRWIILDTEAYT